MHRFKAMGPAYCTHETRCGQIVSTRDTTLSWLTATCRECEVADLEERAMLLDVCRRTAHLDQDIQATNLPRKVYDLILAARDLYVEVSRTDPKGTAG